MERLGLCSLLFKYYLNNPILSVACHNPCPQSRAQCQIFFFFSLWVHLCFPCFSPNLFLITHIFTSLRIFLRLLKCSTSWFRFYFLAPRSKLNFFLLMSLSHDSVVLLWQKALLLLNKKLTNYMMRNKNIIILY